MQNKKNSKIQNKKDGSYIVKNIRPVVIPYNFEVSKFDELKYALAENCIVHFIFSVLNQLGYWLLLVPALPFICLKHYFVILYNAYKELYYNPMKWLRDDEFFNFQTHFKVFIKPQTNWLIKLCSFYHQDKPELLEDIMLEAFESWYYDENGKQECIGFELKKNVQKIANQIKQYKNTIKSENYNLNKAVKTRAELAQKIWNIREHLWT